MNSRNRGEFEALSFGTSLRISALKGQTFGTTKTFNTDFMTRSLT